MFLRKRYLLKISRTKSQEPNKFEKRKKKFDPEASGGILGSFQLNIMMYWFWFLSFVFLIHYAHDS
jgi:hypothetical protein